MAESDDAQLQRTSLLGLVRNHVTLVLTLIPILLSGLRIFAVANGDRPTLVTLLSTLDVKAVLLGTFAWLLPTAFGVAAAMCWIRWLQLRSVSRPLGAGQTTALVWLAVCTTILAVAGVLAASRGPGWRILRATCAAVWLYLGLVASLVLPHHTWSWGHVGGFAGVLVGLGFAIATWRGVEQREPRSARSRTTG